MPLQNSQQSTNVSPKSSITRKIFVFPWIKILRKIGFSPKKTEPEATSEIVLFTLIVALVACVIGYLSGSQAEPPKAWDTFISLALVVCGYDMVKEFIASTVQAVSTRRFEDGKEAILEDYNQIKKEIHTQYAGKTEESIQARLHRYYLSKILKESNGSVGFTWEDISLKSISPVICEESQEIAPVSYQEKLQKDLENIMVNREIRQEVQQLSDEDFLQPLAGLSAMYVLGKDKTKDMDNEPECFLVRDIHAYLKAWLICSIDNDNGVLMPIERIGLSYTSKDNPNKEVYTIAFNYIRTDLLEKEKSKQFLRGRAKESVKEYLGYLIELIEALRV